MMLFLTFSSPQTQLHPFRLRGFGVVQPGGGAALLLWDRRERLGAFPLAAEPRRGIYRKVRDRRRDFLLQKGVSLCLHLLVRAVTLPVLDLV